MRTFYFSLEDGVLYVTETTPGAIAAGGPSAVAWALQYLFNLAH